MKVHLINPSHVSFGIGVITPRWLYVLASATPATYGEPRLVDETLEPLDLTTIHAGDIVGIGIHTGNALRGYEVGTAARAAGATVVFGGIHATLYRQMYANTGIATDSARVNRANRWARLIARPCRLLFTARPLPGLQLPATESGAGVGTEARA